MIHHTGLFFHMAGMILAGGGSIGAILAEKQLWKKINDRSDNAKVFIPVLQSAAILILLGMGVFIISGVIMLYAVNWVFLSEPWFIVKLGCFVLLPLRGAFIGRPTVALISKQLQVDKYNITAFMRLKSRMNRFHIIQFILVAVIVFLVIFKV